MTEKQIEKIKAEIRSNRAKLVAERKKYGDYRDSEGKRYSIAILYAKIGDFKGALRYFNWFDEEFPRDIGDPLFHFIWTVTLFENNRHEKTVSQAYKTAFSNTYLFPLLLDKQVESIDKSELIGFETLGFAGRIKKDCLHYGTDEFFNWLQEFVESYEYQENLNTFIDLGKQIKYTEDGEERRKLLKKERDFINGLTGVSYSDISLQV
jgi:hypothetical protein